MPTARIGDLDLYFERSGTGPPLLFVNGSGTTLATSALWISVLADTFDVLAYDQRGIGQSELPASSYAMADLALEAVALADYVGWEFFNLMGISFGGMVAQEVAVTIPHRLSGLALLCTSSGGAGGSSYPLHALAEMEPEEQLRVRTSIIDSRFTPSWLEDHPRDRMLIDVMAQRMKAPKSQEAALGEALQLQARAGHDTYSRLSTITCPTIIASGQFDGIAPPANGRAMARQIPQAEFHVYQGGHVFFMQDPTALPEVTHFLGSSS